MRREGGDGAIPQMTQSLLDLLLLEEQGGPPRGGGGGVYKHSTGVCLLPGKSYRDTHPSSSLD